MGSKSGGGGNSQSQRYEPWDYQKAHLMQIFRDAASNYETPLEYFEGDTVAGFSPETEAALGAQTDRAQSGSPVTDASQDMISSTLEGDYLEAGNPYFGAMADRVAESVLPRIDARFGVSGAAGSPLAQRAAAQGLADSIGALAYQNYGDERTRQMQGATMAPTIARQDYFDIGKLAEVGAARENLEQEQINEAIARHEFAQMEPWERLGLRNQFVTGSYGGQSETQLPRQRRPGIGSQMLGGGLGGAGLGYMVGGPWGAAAGGGLGALAGLF